MCEIYYALSSVLLLGDAVFINNILREYLDVFIIIYLNDILTFSKIEEEYKKYIKKIFRKLKDENLKIKKI